MKHMLPDPNVIYPIDGYEKEIYIKPTLKNPNIEVGEFSYIADSDFESHVTHHYPWNGDKLIIGKFCQIAAGVEFVMNGANHQMNAVSTYPFFTMQAFEAAPPKPSDLPLKGDTVIGNDVWIGQNAVILPGVHIGDGAIIGANAVVGADVPPYTIVAGNPAKVIRQRFDDELIAMLLTWKWWEKPIEEIKALLPILTSGDLESVKQHIIEDIRKTTETKRLQIRLSNREEMERFIAEQTDEILKVAYTEMLDGCLKHPEQWEWYGIWMIERKDGTHIGELSFKGIDDQGVVEIGYGISPNHWGQGYATEAVHAMTAWALQQNKVTCVTAETEDDNIASRRVLEKCGYVPTGTRGEEGVRFIYKK